MKLINYLENNVVVNEGLKEAALLIGIPLALGTASIGLRIADKMITQEISTSEMNRIISKIENQDQRNKIIKKTIERLKETMTKKWIDKNIPLWGHGGGGRRESKIKRHIQETEDKIEALEKMIK